MKRKMDNTINAGSMADIAFLLLIFFLVATTIESDSGIYVRLPPITNEPPIPLPENKVITVKVNGENRILLEGEEIELQMMSDFLIEEIEMRLEDSTQPIISIQVDRNTEYETYLSAYNEIKKSYRLLRESRANSVFGIDYNMLSKPQLKMVHDMIPMIISEAEPYSP